MDLLATQKSVQKSVEKNRQTWMKVVQSDWKWVNVGESGWMWIYVDKCGWKLLKVVESGWKWMEVDENICDATSISDAAILTYRASPAMAGPCVGASKSGSVDSSGASGGPCCSCCCQVEHKYWSEVGVLMIDMQYIQFNIKYEWFKIVN